jgi:hypothetical protein
MATRFRIQRARGLQDAQEIKQDEGDVALLVEQLRTEMPNARQCVRCGYGPLDHCTCSNLRTHHGKDGINNACLDAKCRSDIADLPSWDGREHAIQCRFISIFVVTPSDNQGTEGDDLGQGGSDQQRFIFAGKPLKDTDTMFDHNIHANTSIHMVMRALGGT